MALQTNNAIYDVGNILKIPNKLFEELTNKLNLCISSIIHDAKLKGEQTTIINIGIGTLGIQLSDMQVKFVPSKDLKQTIKKALQQGVDPLELAIEQALIEKFIAVCKDTI